MITLLGANGSMGRRYQAILRYLQAAYQAFDREEFHLERVASALRSSDRVIIATPTPSHLSLCALVSVEAPGISILCEKPLATTREALEAMLVLPNLMMMAQYTLLDAHKDGDTCYDYFHSGQDGLAWDCCQLIGLARGSVILRNESPIWRCTLNGRALSLDELEQAYVKFVAKWIRNEMRQGSGWLRDIHMRVWQYLEESDTP